MLFCGYCGAKLRYQKWNRSGACKLVCYSRDHSKPYLVKDENCPFEPLWAEDVEEYVLRDIRAIPLKGDRQGAEEDEPGTVLDDLTKERSPARYPS